MRKPTENWEERNDQKKYGKERRKLWYWQMTITPSLGIAYLPTKGFKSQFRDEIFKIYSINIESEIGNFGIRSDCNWDFIFQDPTPPFFF